MEAKEKEAAFRERRARLIELSTPLRALVKEGAIESVNEGLRQIYAQAGHTQLNRFFEWKNQGKQVRKGEKALLLWATPKQKVSTDTGEEWKFFPVCYVFSNLQVD